MTNACWDQFPNIIARETTTKGAMHVQTAATGLMVRAYRYIATEPYIPAVHPAKRSQRVRLNA